MTPNMLNDRGLPAWVHWLANPVAWVATAAATGFCAGLLVGSALVAWSGGTLPETRHDALCAQLGQPQHCTLRVGRKLRGTLVIALRDAIAEPNQLPLSPGVQAGAIIFAVKRGPAFVQLYQKNDLPELLLWAQMQRPCLTTSCAEQQYAGVGEPDLLDTGAVLQRLLWEQGDHAIRDQLRAFYGETGIPVLYWHRAEAVTVDAAATDLATSVSAEVRVGFVTG